MIIRNKYQIVIGPESHIDLADISKQELDAMSKMAKEIINSNESDSIVLAYLAAFVVYITDMQLLTEEYDPDHHKMN
jgi:hypothetical protein